jgi:GNAT superfamily N-acetyltransferase
VIRAAREDDIATLRRVERASNRMFRDVGMAAVAAYEPTSAAELSTMIGDGRAWVVVDDQDRPVACLFFAVVDGCAHIEQVSVDPDHAGRGLGRLLLAKAEELARDRGLAALTLTTFRDVPWNGPYYRRLGFEVLADDELTPGERAIRDRNASGSLGAWPRVTMRRAL